MDLTRAAWRKASASTNAGNCVEVAVNLPGTDRERPNWRRRLAPDVETIFDSIPQGLPARSPGPPVE